MKIPSGEAGGQSQRSVLKRKHMATQHCRESHEEGDG